MEFHDCCGVYKHLACNCNYHYSTGNCEDGSGRCECSPAFLAPNCDACSVGYYDYPECKVCDCHHNGTRDSVCEVGGGQVINLYTYISVLIC